MLEHLLKGGPLMIPLILCSMISLAVVYDRWAAFRANRRVDTRSLRSRVLDHLRNNNITGAIARVGSGDREAEAEANFAGATRATGLPARTEDGLLGA